MYQFSKEEWALLVKLYNIYANVIPVFLQDFMNSFFERHKVDKRIDNSEEITQLVKVLQYFIEDNQTVKMEISEEELLIISDEHEHILEIISKLNRIINDLNLTKLRNDYICEDRDES